MNEIYGFILNDAPAIIQQLHFIRADWLYAFIPLCLYLLLSLKTSLNDKNWQSIIDPRLQPYVLSQTNSKQRRYPLLLVLIAASLCITALAGPVYKQLPQPVYREQSSLVVILDLSQSMNAADIKPSRLSRAKLKLLDLLKTRNTGQTALIVYAAEAFVVTPLTDDNATIANLVPSLETEMMPAQGSKLSKALAKAFSLFTQAGIVNGDILVFTDGIHQRDEASIKKVSSQGHRLSIMGVGTTQGGPIPLTEKQGDLSSGGFLKDRDGAIVIPKLHPEKLQMYALNGSGLYATLKVDDKDIDRLSRLFNSSNITPTLDTKSGDKDLNADIWQEEGHWLLLPLLLFAALWSRKGWLAAALPFTLLSLLQLPHTADAATFDTEHLWFNADQKAMRAFEAGDNKIAAEQFTHTNWKASALYRNGNFEAAAETLKQSETSNGQYNRANALAKLGKLEDAIKAYDKSIEIDADNQDAIYNRAQVKEALQKQKNQGEDESDKNNGEDKESEQQQSGQDKDQQSKENGEQQEQENSDKKNSDNNNAEQQASEENNNQDKQSAEQKQNQSGQQQAEQQQAENEALKQRDAESEKKQQQEQRQQYQQDQNNQDNIENKEGEEKPAEIEINPTEASITEDQKATEQWLKRIPDDPGGLLRRKFYYQYKNAPNQKDEDEPW